MKTRSKVVLGVALFCFLGAAVFVLLRTLRPANTTPEQLITQSLEEAEAAARKRSVNGVMTSISNDFKAGIYNKDRLRVVLLRTLRGSRGTAYDVRVVRPTILTIPNKPKQRVVITRFSAFYSGSGENIWGTGPLTLVMQEERERYLLLFSRPRWRIVSVANMPSLPTEDESGSPFGL